MLWFVLLAVHAQRAWESSTASQERCINSDLSDALRLNTMTCCAVQGGSDMAHPACTAGLFSRAAVWIVHCLEEQRPHQSSRAQGGGCCCWAGRRFTSPSVGGAVHGWV